MADCTHNWQRKEGALKERCTLCGAARVFDENRCNHEWKLRDRGNKESCLKCGAARVALEVDHIKQTQNAPEVKYGH